MQPGDVWHHYYLLNYVNMSNYLGDIVPVNVETLGSFDKA